MRDIRIMRMPHGYFDGGITDICPAITTSSFEHNNFVIETVKINRLFNIYGFTGGSFAGNVYGTDGVSPTINTMGGGNREPLIVTDMKEATQQDLFAGIDLVDESLIDFSCADIEESGCDWLELPPELIGKRFRIRKLTEREVFRLMGVDDKSIDKIQDAGISMTGQYHMAGNSIVVDVLFHLFRKMFIETEADIEPGEQMSLF